MQQHHPEPYEVVLSTRPTIAVIGAGISGLGAAMILQQKYAVTLYEAEPRLGGHARTRTVLGPDGRPVAVDTGFIVWNRRNYPQLGGLFEWLQVPTHASDMSFAVSIGNGWLEYGTQSLQAALAQKRNLLRPRFAGMLRDIFRFNAQALSILDDARERTLGDYLDELHLGDWFRRYYLLPMGGAIWSCPPATMLGFPAKTFVRFFHNHGLLSTQGQPQWYTVTGGSETYVARLRAALTGTVNVGQPVTGVRRTAEGVEVRDASGTVTRFDQVVFACHADTALALLETPTPLEQNILGAFRFQTNQAWLHRDTSLMPKRRAAWASWVYRLNHTIDTQPAISVSYWMNRLQGIDPAIPLFVTLNPERPPQADLVEDQHTFSHPVFDQAAIAAQERLPQIQGPDRVWFCGAWQRYGFHEDGLWSAVCVGAGLGVGTPWTPLH